MTNIDRAADPDTLVTSSTLAHDTWPGCQVPGFLAPGVHRLDLTWDDPVIIVRHG